MKRLLPLFMICLLAASLLLTASAAAVCVTDEADLLTDMEQSALEQQLQDFERTYNLDLKIVLLDSIGEADAPDYNEDHYLEYTFRNDGLILLISMEYRDFDLYAFGSAETYFPAEIREYLMDNCIGSLSAGRYYEAFDILATNAGNVVSSIRGGQSVEDYLAERGYGPEPFHYPFHYVLIAIAGGLIISAIIVNTMKRKLKSVVPQTSADNYIRHNSLNVTQSKDMFLYHTITKTPRPKENSSSSSGGSSYSSGGGHTSGKF